MEIKGKSELVIESVGCGRFQVIHYIIVAIVSYATLAVSNQFMSFGNFNPGWRCLDPYNETVFMDNLTTHVDGIIDDKTSLNVNFSDKILWVKTNVTSEEYTLGDCSVFDSCKHVEFNPESSTIVTEWGLVCNKAWISSFIISLQMTGLLIGSSLAGVVSDAFGRKRVIYLAIFFILIFNTISLFSTSWQMFAALRFLLGIAMAFQTCLYYVYMAEFSTIKWRAIVLGWPCYPLCTVYFGIICLLFKDWRHIHIVAIVNAAIGLIPVFWLPESLRWLEVKKKTAKFHRTAHQIAKWNGKALPDMEDLNIDPAIETNKQKAKEFFQNILQLFGKSHRKYTLITTLPWVSVSLIYYAIAFGIKSLGGNFYLNLILFYGIEVVIDSFLVFVPNIVGRKKSGAIFSGFSGICLLMATLFHETLSGNAKIYAVAIPVMFGRISISAFWAVMKVFMVEIYPTVARGAANSWGLAMARIGGIIAPVLIPKDAGTFSICYAVMAVLAIICAVVVLLLPETKGKALQETFNKKLDVLYENEEKTTES